MTALPRLYTPEEIGDRIGRSGWWVREQCRKGRVPFTRFGGAYRFTRGHFDEILQIFEHPVEQGPQRSAAIIRRAKPQIADGIVPLRARPPRRSRGA